MKRVMDFISRSSGSSDTDDNVSNKKPILHDICSNCGTGWWRDDSSGTSTSSGDEGSLPVACSCGVVHYCSPGCQEAHGEEHGKRCAKISREFKVGQEMSNNLHCVAFAVKQISIKAYGKAGTEFLGDSENKTINNIVVQEVLPKLVALRRESPAQLKYVWEDCKKILPKCKKLIDELIQAWEKCRANPEFPSIEDDVLLEVLKQRIEDEQLASRVIHHQSSIVANKVTGGRVDTLGGDVKERVLKNTFVALVERLGTMSNTERDSFMFKLMFDDSLENVLATMDEAGLSQALYKSDPVFAELISDKSTGAAAAAAPAEKLPKPPKDKKKSAKSASTKSKPDKKEKKQKKKSNTGKKDHP